MTVVLDSNVVTALVLDDHRAKAIEPKMREWKDMGEALHAPALFRYEVANALVRNIVAGQIESADAKAAWQRVMAMPMTFHGLEDATAVIAVAEKLKRESAYDAAYIALAQELKADLWTIDGPLYRNATGVDLPVRLITTE